jgi:voltage-gated potassium channel
VESQEPTTHEYSNAYELFILVITIYSLLIMVALLLPNLSPATVTVLQVYDNAICVLFLFDFGLRLKRAPSKRAYFLGGGWLDLLGSLPSLGFFRLTALLRLARLRRVLRIIRRFRGQNGRDFARDVLKNRGQYAGFVTVVVGLLVMSLSSVLVLQAESHSPDANITTGGKALWWAIVTITTVGYGDTYPTTPWGRIIAAVVMLAGIGIIASLASILARMLIPEPEPAENSPAQQDNQPILTDIQQQLADMRLQMARLEQTLASSDKRDQGP